MTKLIETELKICMLIEAGNSDEDICTKMGISHHSLKSHCKRIEKFLDITQVSAIAKFLEKLKD